MLRNVWKEGKEQTKSFVDLVRSLEVGMFNEFEGMDLYLPPNNRYIYFAPSWHFKRGLVTKEIVKDIKENDRMVLTVGSGPAFLERFLADILAIERDKIYLSDKKEFCVEGFKGYMFDMYGKWPKFRENFDYVLFPESALRREGLYHVLRNSLEISKPKGQVRMDGHGFDKCNFNEVKAKLAEEYGRLEVTCSKSLLVIQKG